MMGNSQKTRKAARGHCPTETYARERYSVPAHVGMEATWRGFSQQFYPSGGSR